MVDQEDQARRSRTRRRVAGACSLAMATMLVVTACGGDSNDSSSGSGKCDGAHKKLHVAFVGATSDQNPMQEMAEGAKAAAKEDGNTKIKVELPPKVDPGKEISMLQSVTHTATDGIAWESVNPDEFVRPLQKVKDADVPLVAVDNMTPKGVKPDMLVSNSNHEVGHKLGEEFVKQDPDPHGTVVLGNDIPTLSVLRDRMSALQQVIKKKLPHMKTVGPFDAKGQGGISKDYQAWQSQINAHPHATAFLGVGGPDGRSLPKLRKKADHDWLAAAGDISEEALNGVKDGQLFALSSPEHFMKGYIAINQIIKQNRKCKDMPSGWWDSGTQLITKKNVDDIIARQKNTKTRLEWFKKHAIDKQLDHPPVKSFDDLD